MTDGEDDESSEEQEASKAATMLQHSRHNSSPAFPIMKDRMPDETTKGRRLDETTGRGATPVKDDGTHKP
ncbi:MAG: hypothetical protein IJP74_04745 [Prevotella sp.]|nr:hypothetical protein [Prevotella sp.]